MFKKRMLATLTALLLLVSQAALGEALPSAVSGEFSGTAKGFGGDVTVTLTLNNGEITAATAEGGSETEGIGSVAVEQLPADIVNGGSIAVDAVAGATITSNAILEAARQALTAAGLNPDDYAVSTGGNKAGEDVLRTCDVVVIGAGGAGMTACLLYTSPSPRDTR